MTHVLRNSLHREFTSTDSLNYSTKVMTFSSFDGENVHNGWCQDKTGTFHEGFAACCSVRADLTPLAATMPWSVNPLTGTKFKDLFVCLLSLGRLTLTGPWFIFAAFSTFACWVHPSQMAAQWES